MHHAVDPVRGLGAAMNATGQREELAHRLLLKHATDAAIPGVADIAPYVAFGAFYFLVSQSG